MNLHVACSARPGLCAPSARRKRCQRSKSRKDSKETHAKMASVSVFLHAPAGPVNAMSWMSLAAESTMCQADRKGKRGERTTDLARPCRSRPPSRSTRHRRASHRGRPHCPSVHSQAASSQRPTTTRQPPAPSCRTGGQFRRAAGCVEEVQEDVSRTCGPSDAQSRSRRTRDGRGLAGGRRRQQTWLGRFKRVCLGSSKVWIACKRGLACSQRLSALLFVPDLLARMTGRVGPLALAHLARRDSWTPGQLSIWLYNALCHSQLAEACSRDSRPSRNSHH